MNCVIYAWPEVVCPFFVLGGDSPPSCSTGACNDGKFLALEKYTLQAGVVFQLLYQVLISNHDIQHEQRDRYQKV